MSERNTELGDGHVAECGQSAEPDSTRPALHGGLTIETCPPVEELWPAAVEERPGTQAALHLEVCSVCQERTQQLAREIKAARALLAEWRAPGRRTPLLPAPQPNGCPEVAASESSQPGVDDVSESAPRPLAAIGRYFVLEPICESGQATIYRGLHPSLLIDVVIKLAHRPCHRDENGRGRLVSEAKALAEIVHPHLARLYDLDFCDDRPFLVLEYVPQGGTLTQYQEPARMAPLEITRLLAKVAHAVSAAHERGILHLDLKPENILVTPEGEPVLIDFGLSSLSLFDEPRFVEGACIAGTPQYMAPEQWRGSRHALTPRTDVFGLGGVLYYLCVGKDPFVVGRANGRLQRPIHPDWRALARAKVPRRLKVICRRALASDPGARFDTAERLAEALDDARRRWERPASFRPRRLALAIFLAGAASLVAGVLTRPDPPPAPATVTLRIERRGRNLPLLEALPLRVHDRVRLEGFVPPLGYAAVFAVNEVGKVQWLGPLEVRPERNRTRIAFPDSKTFLAFSPGPGILLVLLVSRYDDLVRRDGALNLMRRDGSLGNLPRHAAVMFNRKSCALHTRAGTSLSDLQQQAIRRQIEVLQYELSNRFDDYAGILAAVEP